MIFLCTNPNITWDIFRNNHQLSDFPELCLNTKITWDIVKSNPNENWYYSFLSRNPNITWDIVQANPDKKWDYGAFSGNPNVTWDIVRKHPEKPWDFELLVKNKMSKAKINFIMKRKHQEVYQRDVMTELIEVVLHPDNFSKLYGLGHFNYEY